MAKRPLIKPPLVAPPAPSQRDLENAAADARTVMGESKVLQAAVTAMIASRQIYMVARDVLGGEIEHGWDLQNKALVIQTLVSSAQERANVKFDHAELMQTTLGVVVPLLDIVAQQLRDDAKELAKQHPNIEEPHAEPDPAADHAASPSPAEPDDGSAAAPGVAGGDAPAILPGGDDSPAS